MYESKHRRPISKPRFLQRMAWHFAIACTLALLSLFAGMAGYMYFERLAWRDAFLNAAMLLGGMGPVDAPRTDGGKLFAGLYALYAGLVFLVSAGLLFTPLVHRIMHRMHWEDER
jgi:hypothetical protein